MPDASIETEEVPRKGRSNIIMTYEKLEELVLGIQRVGIKVDELGKDLDHERLQHTDHEIRIRALELVVASSTGGKGVAQWLYSALWPAAAFGIAVLSYLK